MKDRVAGLPQEFLLGAASLERTRSEEVATGGWSSDDAEDGLESVEVSPSVDPQRPDRANEVEGEFVGRLITPSSTAESVSNEDEPEPWDLSSLASERGRILLI
jgi:hypothetical protein